MVKTNYAKAYKEVLVILENLIKEDCDKIPKEYIEFLQSNCDNEYQFYYDNSKSFEEQELLDDTKYILFGLFEKFGATELQKEKIKAFKNNYYRKIEEMKVGFDPDDIFNNRKNSIDTEISKQLIEEKSLVENKKISWYQKLFSKILRSFRKN